MVTLPCLYNCFSKLMEVWKKASFVALVGCKIKKQSKSVTMVWAELPAFRTTYTYLGKALDEAHCCIKGSAEQEHGWHHGPHQLHAFEDYRYDHWAETLHFLLDKVHESILL